MKINSDQLTSAYETASSMNAIGLTQLPEIGKVAEALEMVSVPVVRPGSEQVAIRLCASSMHIDEVFAAQGTALGRFYGPKVASPKIPHILGSSVSGIVVGLGEGADKFSLGDEVIVIPDHNVETGSWANYRCVDQKMVMLKPDKYTHVEAAAITMAACVAWGAIGFSKAQSGDNCLVVGASGSIGIMIVQYLKTIGCNVSAVCSGKNSNLVRENGADAVIDYTQTNFGDLAEETGEFYDRVFDCVGGRDIERNAFRTLKKHGVFETVVGPMQYIGERKLSWFEFLKVMTHILTRMVVTTFSGPRYMFGEKFPRLTIKEAFEQAEKHNLHMPVERVIPFQVEAVADAIRLLISHRAKGRIVIDFDLDRRSTA
jgi:NADPH:quinone reductase-like Zn-dependent oxidoreductase